MRVGFAGTPDFARVALEAILDAGFRVELVLTQPDRPHGRRMRTEPGPVKALALAHGLKLVQPATLKAEREREALIANPLDVLVVAAYGLLLPSPVLVWPRNGCINVHASLLPRWRGAAPIARALLAGDTLTGISIMRIDEGLDTGPVIAQHELAIEARETAGSLHDKLAALGGQMIVETLAKLARGEALEARPQDGELACYAPKLARAEATIGWEASAVAIDRVVRALDPTPGAQTSFDGEALKIWQATPWRGRFGAPGTVIRADASGIVVACGDGALVVTELQRPGGRRMSAGAFIAGHRIGAGTRLGGHAR